MYYHDYYLIYNLFNIPINVINQSHHLCFLLIHYLLWIVLLLVVVIPANFWKSKGFYAWQHFNDCVFSRHFGLYVCFNDFQFLVSHVHQFHIFVAVFLKSMSHVHVSHHIIYLYKVVPIKFVSLEVSCSYWSKLKNFKNWNNMNQKITERHFTEFG